MTTKTHLGVPYTTKQLRHGFVPYLDLGALCDPPRRELWTVNRGIGYTSREWAERQAMWAIEDRAAGKKVDLSVLPGRR